MCVGLTLSQRGVTNWFGKEYVTTPWHTWYVTAGAAVPTFDSNANNIESFHTTIPRIDGIRLRGSIERVLMVSLPALVRNSSLRCFTSEWLLQPAFVPEDMLTRAVQRIEKGIKKICFSPCLQSSVMFVLARHYTEKYPRCNIDTKLIQQYVASLKGNFGACKTKEEAQDLAGMMHVVHRDERYKGASNPGFRCDCKTFMHICLCPCVLIAAHYSEELDLHAMASPLRQVRPAGRPVTKQRRKRGQRKSKPVHDQSTPQGERRATGGRPRAAQPALQRQNPSPLGKYSSAVYKRGNKKRKAAYINARRILS